MNSECNALRGTGWGTVLLLVLAAAVRGDGVSMRLAEELFKEGDWGVLVVECSRAETVRALYRLSDCRGGWFLLDGMAGGGQDRKEMNRFAVCMVAGGMVEKECA